MATAGGIVRPDHAARRRHLIFGDEHDARLGGQGGDYASSSRNSSPSPDRRSTARSRGPVDAPRPTQARRRRGVNPATTASGRRFGAPAPATDARGESPRRRQPREHLGPVDGTHDRCLLGEGVANNLAAGCASRCASSADASRTKPAPSSRRVSGAVFGSVLAAGVLATVGDQLIRQAAARRKPRQHPVAARGCLTSADPPAGRLFVGALDIHPLRLPPRSTLNGATSHRCSSRAGSLAVGFLVGHARAGHPRRERQDRRQPVRERARAS